MSIRATPRSWIAALVTPAAAPPRPHATTPVAPPMTAPPAAVTGPPNAPVAPPIAAPPIPQATAPLTPYCAPRESMRLAGPRSRPPWTRARLSSERVFIVVLLVDRPRLQ